MCNRDVQLGTTTEHLPQYPKGLGVYPMLQEISKETSVIDRIKDKTGNLNHTTRCVIKFKKKKAKISFTRYKAIQDMLSCLFLFAQKKDILILYSPFYFWKA